MKDITKSINESIQAKWIKQLETLACDMFRKYDSSWNIDADLKPWVEGKENPTTDDYWEMIDDILAYCDEENIKLTGKFKKMLDMYQNLDTDDQEEIEVAILRGMSIRVAEDA